MPQNRNVAASLFEINLAGTKLLSFIYFVTIYGLAILEVSSVATR